MIRRPSPSKQWSVPGLTVLAVFTFFFSPLLYAQTIPAIVLLDVSGSMEREHGVAFSRYSRGFASGTSQMQILANRLGAALDAHCRCPVYLLPFSSSKEPYSKSGPWRGSQLAEHLPDTARGRETELDHALRQGLGHAADALVFIVTDNKNEFGGNTSDDTFYSMLAHDPSVHSVYFVPLGEPGSTQDALVFYAIASGQASRAVLRSVAEDFAAAVKSEAVQFRPLYEPEKGRPQLGFSQHIMHVSTDGEERVAELEGDSIVVSSEEGHPLDGFIKFRLHSNLKHWRIHEGQLKQVQVKGDVPPEFVGAGQFSMPIALSGSKKLTVSPGGDSTELYTLPLSTLEDSGVVLRRNRLFQTELPDIRMRVQLNAVITLAQRGDGAGIQRAFPEALEKRIKAVAHLDEIMNAMTFQSDATSSAASMERSIPVTRELIIRVRPDGVKNFLARGLLFALPLLLIAAIAGGVVAMRSHPFTLVDPTGRARTVAFSLTRRNAPLQWNGRTVGKLAKSGRGFEIHTERGFKAEPTRLQGPGRFQVNNLGSREVGQFQLTPGAASTKSASQGVSS